MFRVKFLRIHHKLSQYDLAEVAHLRQTVVSSIERGRANPTDRELKLLADALGFAGDPAPGGRDLVFTY
jgi:transcriptional regulator with XRE-family HTH domain